MVRRVRRRYTDTKDGFGIVLLEYGPLGRNAILFIRKASVRISKFILESMEVQSRHKSIFLFFEMVVVSVIPRE